MGDIRIIVKYDTVHTMVLCRRRSFQQSVQATGASTADGRVPLTSDAVRGLRRWPALQNTP